MAKVRAADYDGAMLPPSALSPAAAVELLSFYRDLGIEDALDDAPHDRFAESAGPTPRSASEGRITAPVPASVPVAQARRTATVTRRADADPVAPDDAVLDARTRAGQARSLDELRAAMESFDGCSLKKTALQLVFADGNPKARLMLVGEGPGQEEDRQGLPFVGRSGQLLDRMLKTIGLDRGAVYIANVVPWRPPGNRTPTVQEIAICRPFIERQIELVNPDLLVCIGLPSAQALLQVRDGITKARGRWMSYSVGGREIPAMAILHPAYLLRSPAQKKYAWRDLKAIRAKLREGLPGAA